VCHKKQKEHEENGGSERKKIEAVRATIELFQNLYQCSHNVMFWKKQEEDGKEREKKKKLSSLILSEIFGEVVCYSSLRLTYYTTPHRGFSFNC